MKPGDVVVIGAFDEVPEHWFRVEEVLDECITGNLSCTWWSGWSPPKRCSRELSIPSKPN